MISLDEAKSHLRIDYEDDDAGIAQKLKLASAIVVDYVGATVYQEIVYENYATDAEYEAAASLADRQNSVADAATLLVLGELYANREAHSAPLSPTVKIILERLRVPCFA